MEAKVNVDAGICGFKANIKAVSEDGMNVTFKIVSACETIKELAELIEPKTPIDAYQELMPTTESTILNICRQVLVKKGCCEACAVPAGICKAMYVVAGLALPKDVAMKITKS